LGTDATHRAEPARSLGATWTSFVGRDDELAALRAVLALRRWIAIVGPPGVGKTRLADELLRDRAATGDIPPGGLWRVSLAGIADPSSAIAAIAAALELTVAAASLHELAAAFERRSGALLVLDGIDVLGPQANALIAALLAAPELRVVTTALRRNGVGECVFDLTPLNERDAVQLFVDRARAVRHDFELAGHEAAVARLARALDGVPLAIELAAARMRALTPEQLVRQPDRLLGEPGNSPLHTALVACWGALTDRERAALGQLSVFRGGFDLDSATAVVDLAAHGHGAGMDAVLADLRDASLIQVLPGDATDTGVLRFGMLELVREYAAAHCDDIAAARVRHATHIVAGTRALARELDRADGARARRRIAIERDNLLAISEGPDPTVAVDAACVLAWAGLATGPYDELAALVGRTLDRGGARVPLAARAEAWWLRAEMLRQAGRLDQTAHALARLRELPSAGESPVVQARIAYASAALASARGDLETARVEYRSTIELAPHEPSLAIRALCDLGTIEISLDDLDAGRSHFEAALAAAQAREDERGEGCARAGLGIAALRAGQLTYARLELERALRLHRSVDDRGSQAIARCYLAVVALLAGGPAAAETDLCDALGLARWMGHRLIEATTLGYLGVTLHVLGRLDEAEQHQEAALALFRRLASRSNEALALARLGAVHADRGAHERAASLLEAAEGIEHVDLEIAAVIIMCRAHVDAKRGGGTTRALEQVAAAARAPLQARLQGIALQRSLAGAEPGAAPFEIGPRGRWFRTPDGRRVGLERRGAPSRVLAFLAERRCALPADVVPTDRIFDAGWPGEHASAEAAAQRVYTAIWTLRRLGLRDVVVRAADGYLLDPAVPVVVRD
jgi:predicted ATPase